MKTKAEYIAKYGEEAWEKESQKRSERRKRFREKNPDYNKEWHKKYRIKNREKCREKEREYYKKNPEKHIEYSKRYREKNPGLYSRLRKEYYNTKHGRAVSLFHNYLDRDAERGFNTKINIDSNWIENNILNGQICFYCGESDWRKLGVDRIDNTKGHTPDNCVCACEKCNKKRQNKYTVEEFVELMKKEKGGA